MATTNIVETTGQQALLGHAVGTGTEATCFVCGAPLREGDAVRVIAYRPAEADAFTTAQLACRGCRDDDLTPTLGVTDLLADAWLAVRSLPAARRHRLVLTEIEVRQVVGPEVGAGR